MKNLSANTAKYSLIQANDATGLHIQDDGGNGLFIKDGGNIGIGTSAPDVKLAVVGTTSANAYTFYQNALTDASEAIHRPTTGQLAIRANSQERVRIDASGNVGIGTSSPGALLHLNGGAANNQAIFESTDGTSSIMFKDPSGTAEFGNKGDSAVIMPAGVEKMRITSDGKIGIGITEPKHELHIYNTTSAPRIRLQCGNSSNAALLFGDAGDDTEAGILWNAATESLAIRGYNNTDRITILNNGNVGVGTVIPDVRLVVADNHPGDDVALRVWNSSTTDNSTTSLRFTNTSSTNYDHGYIIAGRTPNPYMQFGVADSVTAMYIDSTGNVGIGTTSPDYTLEVKKSVENWVSRIYNTRSTTGSAGLLVRSDASDFDSHAFGVHAGGSYKLSVRCDGKIGMGTISPLDILHVNGNITIGGDQAYSYIRPPVAGMAIKMGAHSATWDRDFYIGHSDNNRVFSPYLHIKAQGESMMHGSNIIGDNVNGAGEILTGGGAIIIQNHTSHGDQSLFLVKTGSSKNLRMQIKCDGDLENINNSYSGISDIKLKENIIDANSQWEDIKSLQVRNYNFKPDTGYHDNKQIGLIAQEVEETCPGLVSVSIDEQTDVETKSVKYSVLYMKAVKALQEAMQRIETLEQRIDTLENK